MTEKYNPEHDPEMMRYWMTRGPKTAAFLLLIPGSILIGVGVGLLQTNLLPYSLIGFGAGFLISGLIVVFSK